MIVRHQSASRRSYIEEALAASPPALSQQFAHDGTGASTVTGGLFYETGTVTLRACR